MTDKRNDTCKQRHIPGRGHKGHGPSSAWMHDPKTVLDLIPLKEGQVFADLGCGTGDYAIEASTIVGTTGRVYALDKLPYLIDNLSNTIKSPGLKNITPITADITEPLPIDDKSVDVAFIATVLHIFDLKRIAVTLFVEVSRILKPSGRLAVVECKKEDQPFGPPEHMRNSPEELIAALSPCGFIQRTYTDLGYNYIIQVEKRQ